MRRIAQSWATVKHMDWYSDGAPAAHDLSALTATPDTILECSMRTAVTARGNLFAQAGNSAHAPAGALGAHSHAIPTQETAAHHTTGLTAVYDNSNANITMTEAEPHMFFTAVLITLVTSRASAAPNMNGRLFTGAAAWNIFMNVWNSISQ